MLYTVAQTIGLLPPLKVDAYFLIFHYIKLVIDKMVKIIETISPVDPNRNECRKKIGSISL
jgi:hypothetical protein